MVAQSCEFVKFWVITSSFITFFVFSTGCSRPHPAPELLDPIFADLGQRASVAKAGAETKKEEIKTLRKEIEDLPARDIGRRKMQEDLKNKERQMMAAEQEALYYEIRTSHRKDYARIEYIKAFDKGESWPDPKDFETYKIQRKLRDAPREWSAKLPKSDRYNKKSQADIRKDLDERFKSASGGAN
jgi:hypothetical protein